MNVINMKSWAIKPSIVLGKVKWYDVAKGFGFITAPSVPGDILLHANSVRSFGQSSVSPDAVIECTVEENAGRYRVTDIIRYEPTEATRIYQDAALLDQTVLQPARTKWFCQKKAYGFAVAFEAPGDIFIGHLVLRAAGLTHLEQGEAIALATKQTENGLVAIKVSPWK